MTHQEFSKSAAAHALKLGCDNCETYYAHGEAFEVNAQGGEIDRYSVSREAGVSVRVSFGGRDGYAYTERLEEPEKLVERALDNARCIETDDPNPMQGFCEYKPAGRKPSPIGPLSEQERIALIKRLEQLTLAADPRVQRVVYCTLEYHAGGVSIENTRGCRAERASDAAMLYVMPSVLDGEEVQTGMAFRMGADVLDVEGCAREAVDDALGKLGGKPAASGAYPVIFKNFAMGDLLAAFAPMFSADEAQKGCSLLAGKEGQEIASPLVTIVDDPLDPIAPRAFDAEGTPCRRKAVVEAGVLKTLLHNLKTAAKAGVESTGNASRPRASSPLGVAPTVLRFEPGALSFEALLAHMGSGLLVTELDGLHAGVDEISGDFSLKASGFFVENGEIGRAVSGVTVAGNFIDMMKRVSALGSDFRCAMPQAGYFGAPSVLIESLTVAGS